MADKKGIAKGFGRDGATPAQEAAIGFGRGCMLVLAGPGSGKTYVITSRVKRLIEKGVAPEKILTVTFTRSAAAEMKQRAVRTLSIAGRAAFGTFHGVFYQILRSSGHFGGYTFLTPYERKRFMAEAAGKSADDDGADDGINTDELLSDVSYCKNNGRPENGSDEAFMKIFDSYQKILEREKKLDYDDMLICCARVLKDDPAFLSFWQERFEMIQVDEFQDINPVQYEVIRLLAGKNRNLFVVGDDDQAIYSFRGADPGCMKRFMTDYPDAQKLSLDMNFRSCPRVVELTGRLIKHNADRFDKKIICAKGEAAGDYAGVVIYGSKTGETDGIVKCIKEHVDRDDGSVAVLLRVNASMERFASALMKENIPYFIKEKRRALYQDPLSKSFRAFLAYLYCGRKRGHLFAFLNAVKDYGVKREYFTDDIVDMKSAAAEAQKRGNSRMQKSILRLAADIDTVYALDYFGTLNFFLNAMGAKEKQMTGCGRDRKKAELAVEAVDGLFEAEEYMTGSGCLNALRFFEEYERSFLELNDEDQIRADPRAVRILTYHGAKGLEFDHVYVPGVISNLVPKGNMLSAEEMEEERRMFYVALTRAKKTLTVSCFGDGKGRERSVFIEELTKG